MFTGLVRPGRRRRLVGSLPAASIPSDCPSVRLRYPLRLRGGLRYLRLLETPYTRLLTSVRWREERQDAREYRRAVSTR